MHSGCCHVVWGLQVGFVDAYGAGSDKVDPMGEIYVDFRQKKNTYCMSSDTTKCTRLDFSVTLICDLSTLYYLYYTIAKITQVVIYICCVSACVHRQELKLERLCERLKVMLVRLRFQCSGGVLETWNPCRKAAFILKMRLEVYNKCEMVRGENVTAV